ncbi:hypothetical protein TVAG_174580 [Trichomonas vaginalis G3]|uniref:Uncharacterized protein n=1 Tax=Trichomonas vaginalis (strain ATCC PRA-98 / G3) TaxID=412133 RepID=A2EK05_TRIV3|nr:hypothetical protein TVAGG3_0974490 [Trichomonas vaginalis G3]EAY06989.1 hypothetical protein TVAG_174580 [Trichomonas vaginalis G3]KAI5488831.1 hypothetical protein TVAGG3_0974490 [Trichomonas vaginalis G3]|eukprot:XP_001319212.1 hypothetical protein [Trichomonas vaginalis G3]
MRSELTEQREKLKRGFTVRKSFGENYSERTMDVSKFTQSIQKFKDLEQSQLTKLNNQIDELKSEQTLLETKLSTEKEKKEQIINEISVTCTKSLNKIASCASKIYDDSKTIEYLMSGTVSLSQLLQDVLIKEDCEERLDSFQIELESNMELLKNELDQLKLKESSSKTRSEEVNALLDTYNTLKQQYENLDTIILNQAKFELDEAKSKIKSRQASAASMAAEIQKVNEKIKQLEQDPNKTFNDATFDDLQKHIRAQASLFTENSSRISELKQDIAKNIAEKNQIDQSIQQVEKEIEDLMKEIIQ